MFGINFNKAPTNKTENPEAPKPEMESSVIDQEINQEVQKATELLSEMEKSFDAAKLAEKLEKDPQAKERLTNNLKKVTNVLSELGLLTADKFNAMLEKIDPDTRGIIEIALGSGAATYGALALDSGEVGAAISTEKVAMYVPLVLAGMLVAIHGYMKSDFKLPE